MSSRAHKVLIAASAHVYAERPSHIARSFLARASATVRVVKRWLIIDEPPEMISTCTPPIAKRMTHLITRPSSRLRRAQSVESWSFIGSWASEGLWGNHSAFLLPLLACLAFRPIRLHPFGSRLPSRSGPPPTATRPLADSRSLVNDSSACCRSDLTSEGTFNSRNLFMELGESGLCAVTSEDNELIVR